MQNEGAVSLRISSALDTAQPTLQGSGSDGSTTHWGLILITVLEVWFFNADPQVWQAVANAFAVFQASLQ